MAAEAGRCAAAVVDANCFIANFDPRRVAESLVTTEEVAAEVKDKHARAFQQLVEAASGGVQSREPRDDDVAWVVRFARRTGDAPALSRADVRLLALTLTVEREKAGHDRHIRRVPPPLERAARHAHKGASMPGWGEENTADDEGWDELDALDDDGAPPAYAAAAAAYAGAPPAVERSRVAATPTPMPVDAPPEDVAPAEGDDGGAGAAGADEWEPVRSRASRRKAMRREGRRARAVEDASRELEAATAQAEAEAAQAAAAGAAGGDGADKGEGGDEDNEDNDGHGDVDDAVDDGAAGDDDTPASVAIITADRAMQNVALQMKLKLVSPTGEVVDRVRRYVLQCSACLKLADMARSGTAAGFCGYCGSWGCLVRATVEVSPTGATVVVDQRTQNKLRALRGTKYSLPKPRGGREGLRIILREDQLAGVAAAGDAPRPESRKAARGGGGEEEEEEEDRAMREHGASNAFKMHRHEAGGLGKRNAKALATEARLGFGPDGAGAIPVVDGRGAPHLRRNPNKNAQRKKGK